MEPRTDSENPQFLQLELEFIPEDEHDADPLAVGEASRDVVATLKKNGYVVQPVYTGERGGFLFAIPLGIMVIGQAIAAHQDLLIELFKVVQPVVAYIFKDHGKKATSGADQGQIKVAIAIDDAYISVEASNIENVERLMQLAQEFRTKHPATAAKVTAISKIKIKGAVPKRQQRRRR